jgi:hypothetical protein
MPAFYMCFDSLTSSVSESLNQPHPPQNTGESPQTSLGQSGASCASVSSDPLLSNPPSGEATPPGGVGHAEASRGVSPSSHAAVPQTPPGGTGTFWGIFCLYRSAAHRTTFRRSHPDHHAHGRLLPFPNTHGNANPSAKNSHGPIHKCPDQCRSPRINAAIPQDSSSRPASRAASPKNASAAGG